jgi:hypothetical protein
MAIDRGPWNALVDDDGSNLVGSIWNKQAIKDVLLDPIDNSLLAHGTFTPTDASGAGLAFGFTQGKFSGFGRLIFVWLQVVYPATSNGAFAKIGGFPHVVRTPAGVSQGYGPTKAWWLPEGSTTFEPHDLTTFAHLTNAQVSGANLIVSATYLTD